MILHVIGSQLGAQSLVGLHPCWGPAPVLAKLNRALYLGAERIFLHQTFCKWSFMSLAPCWKICPWLSIANRYSKHSAEVELSFSHFIVAMLTTEDFFEDPVTNGWNKSGNEFIMRLQDKEDPLYNLPKKILIGCSYQKKCVLCKCKKESAIDDCSQGL